MSVAALTKELEAANVGVQRITEMDEAKATIREAARVARQRSAEIEEEIAGLQQQLTRLGAERDDWAGTVPLHEAKAEALAKQLDAAKLPDRDAIRDRIASAEETNSQVRANVARAAQAIELRRVSDSSTTLSARIEALDDSKAEQIAAAKMPVDGLGFDESGVTLGGVPFEQASSAEQLAVSVGMGLAMNPKLKLLLIRDGSLLDSDNRRLIAEMAEAADAQVWMECVEENESTSVVIVDGAVAGAEERPAA